MSTIFALFFFATFPAMAIAMIWPNLFSRFFKKGVTRGKIALVVGGVMLASFIGVGATAPPVEDKPTSTAIEQTPETVNATDEKVADSTTVPPAIEAPPETKPSAEAQLSATVKVIKVVDGDTLAVEIDGKSETIRIIGINTPETVDPRKSVECFGTEASAKARSLLNNQTVRLEADATQGERDKYDRLLRYVFMTDGSDFGKRMISEGYAFEYTYSTAYKYQLSYKTAQTEAKAAKLGLWADEACLLVQTSPVIPTVVTNTTSTPAVTSTNTDAVPPTVSEPIIEPEPSTPPPATNSYSCSTNTYNCPDFTTQPQAQAVYDECMAQVGSDIHRLDGSDKDGVVCEALPQ